MYIREPCIKAGAMSSTIPEWLQFVEIQTYMSMIRSGNVPTAVICGILVHIMLKELILKMWDFIVSREDSVKALISAGLKLIDANGIIELLDSIPPSAMLENA